MENEDELDQEQQEKLKNLWKSFGRETKMGKQLFSLYNKAEKPKINYPKPKPKSQKQIDAEKEKMISTKKCPQKTMIDYPQLPKQSGPTFHPVDFIPKRKAENVIRKEIQEYKMRRARQIPANRGVDRAALVRKLQQRFNQQTGGLPKGAQLPGIEGQINFDQKKIKQNAKLRVQKKFKNYSEPVKKQQSKQNTKQRNMNDELDRLFQDIVGQIDDRQKYLDSIDHLQEPELKAKIKKQMIERIAQLQRISEMKNKS